MKYVSELKIVIDSDRLASFIAIRSPQSNARYKLLNRRKCKLQTQKSTYMLCYARVELDGLAVSALGVGQSSDG
jgi:hypothetical protein